MTLELDNTGPRGSGTLEQKIQRVPDLLKAAESGFVNYFEKNHPGASRGAHNPSDPSARAFSIIFHAPNEEVCWSALEALGEEKEGVRSIFDEYLSTAAAKKLFALRVEMKGIVEQIKGEANSITKKRLTEFAEQKGISLSAALVQDETLRTLEEFLMH